MDDAGDGPNSRHNADEPAEEAQALQRNPVRREHFDILLHNVHLDLHKDKDLSAERTQK